MQVYIPIEDKFVVKRPLVGDILLFSPVRAVEGKRWLLPSAIDSHRVFVCH